MNPIQKLIQKLKTWPWPVIASVLAGVAGIVGTILTPIFGADVAASIANILQSLSGLLIMIPVSHAVAIHIVRTKALLARTITAEAILPRQFDYPVRSSVPDGPRKSGKRGAVITSTLSVSLDDHRTDVPLPKPSAPFDWAKKVIGDFPMADNNRLGNCTIAGFWHLIQLAYAACGVACPPYPGDAAIAAAYWKLVGHGPTSADDEGPGLSLETVMTAATHPEGLFGVRLIGWGSINIHSFADMEDAIYNFGGIYLAGNIPQSAETDFEHDDGEWVLHKGHNPGIGGHCFIGSGSDMKTYFDNITWGAENRFSFPWWHKYGLQGIVAIPEVFQQVGHGALASVNVASLQAAMKARTV